MTYWLTLSATIIVAAMVVPFGMLPSILIFRDVANGTDVGPIRKRLSGVVLWGGILFSWVVATLLVFNLLESLHR